MKSPAFTVCTDFPLMSLWLMCVLNWAMAVCVIANRAAVNRESP